MSKSFLSLVSPVLLSMGQNEVPQKESDTNIEKGRPVGSLEIPLKRLSSGQDILGFVLMYKTVKEGLEFN